MAKQVYRVDYRLQGEQKDRRSYVYAESADAALGKLEERFPGVGIQLNAIIVEHGEFVIASEEPPKDPTIRHIAPNKRLRSTAPVHVTLPLKTRAWPEPSRFRGRQKARIAHLG